MENIDIDIDLFNTKCARSMKQNESKIETIQQKQKLVDTYRTYGDELIGMIHHCNEKIEQDNDVNEGETTEHDQTPEPRELKRILSL